MRSDDDYYRDSDYACILDQCPVCQGPETNPRRSCCSDECLETYDKSDSDRAAARVQSEYRVARAAIRMARLARSIHGVGCVGEREARSVAREHREAARCFRRAS